MKAVVMEKRSGHAALLTDGGDVVRARDRGYEIGEVIDMKENKEGNRGRIIAILSAAAIFVMLFAGGIFAYNTPYYYVSMDVNPGMVMEVNRFERVIGVEAMNEEAQAVLSELRLRNMNIEDAVAEALGGISSAGYLANENNNVVIAALSKNTDNAERLAGKLKGAAEEEILDNGVRAEVSAGVLGYDMVQQAKELGITPGKLNIITNLLGEEATEENMATSIRDLMSRYTTGKSNRDKNKTGDENSNQGEGSDNGQNGNAGETGQNQAGDTTQAGEQQGNMPSEAPGPGGQQGNAPSETPVGSNTQAPGNNDGQNGAGQSDSPGQQNPTGAGSTGKP